MNIKIKKEDFEFLMSNKVRSFTVGSHLYETNTPQSDKDILVIYDYECLAPYYHAAWFLPNHHQFQYDDIENNTQYIFSTLDQFFKNLFSGDSTINADIILWSDEILHIDSVKLRSLRTYKIIKGFIGFAKRDLKNYKGKNKVFHAARSLYTASCLIDNKLPSKTHLQEIALKKHLVSIPEYREQEKTLRKRCNEMLESGELKFYPEEFEDEKTHPLFKKLIKSNNIKEFKYN